MGDDEDRMCYVGNFTSLVTADLLEELFTQVGPVEKVTLTDRNSYRFAMVTFEDEESVPFAVRTLDGIGLFDTPLRVKPRNGSKHESICKSATSSIRRDSHDGRHPSSSGSESLRESYGRRWHTHLPPMSSSAVLSTLTPPALPPPHISPLKTETQSTSTPRCDASSIGSRFWRRSGSMDGRTFPEKPSKSREFENKLKGDEKWYGSSWRRPNSYGDARYSNSSVYRTTYKYRRF